MLRQLPVPEPNCIDTEAASGLDIPPASSAQARRCGIRVILSLVDNWKYPGGIDEVVDWSPTAPRRTQDRPPDKEGDSEFVVRSATARRLEINHETSVRGLQRVSQAASSFLTQNPRKQDHSIAYVSCCFVEAILNRNIAVRNGRFRAY